MAKKYDLIIVGAGPAGLMAAKTAAEDGLKVILVERKRNITEINRACSQIFYTNKLAPLFPAKDAYIEPVSVECEANKTRFHFPVPGFSVDYEGCLRPYLNWIHLSPSGYQINRYKLNERPWGFYFHKETFLAGLYASAEKAGSEVLPETIGLGAENTKDGVEVRVQGKSGKQTLEARTAIAAEGVVSKIADSLGLNKKRQVLIPRGVGFVHYIMEEVETGLPDSSWLTWTFPSLNSYGNIMIGLSADNRLTVGAMNPDPVAVLNEFMNHPKWAHMFRHVRVVKKEASVGTVLSPIREPVAGNVVIVGDAAGEGPNTWIQGASACGYQAVKAIEKELNGQKGYPEYIAWWQQAFAFNAIIPDYAKMLPSNVYGLSKVCSDEEVDDIYSLFQGKTGIPSRLVNDNLELIKERRPGLYEKLTKGKR